MNTILAIPSVNDLLLVELGESLSVLVKYFINDGESDERDVVSEDLEVDDDEGIPSFSSSCCFRFFASEFVVSGWYLFKWRLIPDVLPNFLEIKTSHRPHLAISSGILAK